jgi:protein-tyrosine phosphatase
VLQIRINTVRGFIDLHCHYIASIDDGCRGEDEGRALLEGLYQLGFAEVVATPHMRPGMFDNDRTALEQAFARTQRSLEGVAQIPRIHLSCEHYFDEIVHGRLLAGQGLPYPGRSSGQKERSVLVEFEPTRMPIRVEARLRDLRRAGLWPVIAHPERYHDVWRDDRCLDALLDVGAKLLLDVAALAGKYGQAPQDAAEKLLDEGAYEAACSDAHRPQDLAAVATGIRLLTERVGTTEAERLLRDGPAQILSATP